MAKKKTKKIEKKKTAPITAKSIGVIPLHDRILIKPIEENISKTASGIFIPDTVSKEKPETGIVVAVGAGKYDDGKLVAPSVKVGDKVMFSKYGFDEIKVDGQEYFILREENILAVIKN